MSDEQKKVCRSCNTPKARSAFGKNSNNPDGLQNECKKCRKAYQRTYRKRLQKRKAPNPTRRRIVLGTGKKGMERKDLLLSAISCGRVAARSRKDYEAAAHLAELYRSVRDVESPYVIDIWHPGEWLALSSALRPEGSSPTPGSEQAHWYSFYQWILKSWHAVL